MILEAGTFSGRTTFVTGPEKGCGKTSLLNRALGLLREAGERPAFLGVGFDGEGRDALSASRAPRIACRAGEVFMSAERYLRGSAASPEILEVLPGASALGRLAVARATRDGEAVLVGPERNELLAWALSRVAEEGWARSVLVDGAINRITQVAAFPGARFVFSLRVSPAELERQVARLRLMHRLAGLPRAGAGDEGLEAPVHRVSGPLTRETAALVPEGAATVVVEDFTKIFLDLPALTAFLRSRTLAVRAAPEFAGFVVVPRELPRERVVAALREREGEGAEAILARVAWNPYEPDEAGRAA